MICQPSSVIIAGPSGCGKTVMTESLLRYPQRVFAAPPDKMVYTHDIWQPRFEKMKHLVHFFKGIPTTADLNKWFGNKKRGYWFWMT